MVIAVVGSGISGLVSAHVLSQKHEVHLFEANPALGGHTNTIRVGVRSGRYQVDTGFIVFNDWTYPNFIRLMSKIGVASRASSMSFSVKVEATGLEYNGTDINRLFIQRRNILKPSFYRMIRDILRFNREAPGDPAISVDTTLGSYLESRQYSVQFRDHYIIPMGSAIWSASARQMMDFPAAYFLRFFKNHGMLSVDNRPQWRVIEGGSCSYIPHLAQPLKDRVHLNAPVVSVARKKEGVFLEVGGGSKAKKPLRFDQVVLACHADQAIKMLSNASPLEKEVLGAFSYQENPTLLHTDASVLPENPGAWASWNYWVPAEPRSKAAVTYNMNLLQGISAPETFCVSLNMEDKVAPDKILKKIIYHHPVYTRRAVAAQDMWQNISGLNGVHFCGAYWGFGFHEDGVKSALRVCETLGVSL